MAKYIARLEVVTATEEQREAGVEPFAIWLASDVPDEFGQLPPPVGPYNAEAAAAMGFPLPAIVEAINADLAAENERLREAVRQKDAELAEVRHVSATRQ